MSPAARAAAPPRRKPAPPAVPAVWARDVESVLIAEPALRRRVASLARQINREYAGRDLVVVGLMTGSLVFLGDLLRQLTLPLAVDLMEISSYGAGTIAGQLVCTKDLSLPVRGRDVLVVDDILDTGRTLLAVKRRLQRKRRGKPFASCSTSLPGGRRKSFRITPGSRSPMCSWWAMDWTSPNAIATCRSSAC